MQKAKLLLIVMACMLLLSSCSGPTETSATTTNTPSIPTASPTATAEPAPPTMPPMDVSFHNGVRFGMSAAEVTELERSHGVTLTVSKHSAYILETTTTVAKQSDTDISFGFGKADSLYSITYTFPNNSTYRIIENSLRESYGSTEFSSETNRMFPGVNGVFYPQTIDRRDSYFPSDIYDVTDYSHRLIQISEEEHLIIEHYATVYRHSGRSHDFMHSIRYILISAEEAQQLKDLIEDPLAGAGDDL